MKTIYLIFTCFFLSITGFSQDKINFKKYSYSEFFEMIEEEPSDTFTLKNAAIVFDSITDMAHAAELNLKNFKFNLLRKDTITINKKLVLDNIFFSGDPGKRKKYYGRFYFIKFQKAVSFTNCLININHCLFRDTVSVRFNEELDNMYESYFNRLFFMQFVFDNSSFKKGIYFNSFTSNSLAEETKINVQFGISNCEFWPLTKKSNNIYGFNFFVYDLNNFFIDNSIFYGEDGFSLTNNGGRALYIESNDFKDNYLDISLSRDKEVQNLSFKSNIINKPTELELGYLKPENNLDFKQFKKGIYHQQAMYEYIKVVYDATYVNNNRLRAKDSVRTDYMENGRHSLDYTFKEETKFLGKLKSHYISQHDKEYENAVFMEIKDLETKRFEYLYTQNPSFKTFFKWRINQFLKVFSAYGTEPERAVIFSMYVILIFAFIYLLFPNSWDKHGRNRIMNRYRFFTKYMNKEAGIHEVYLDEQKEELLASEDFKNYMLKAEKSIPKFFMATAIPLYKWSISGTRISSSLLKRVDVMKGTWSGLPKSKQIWKSILLIGAFTIAVLYDILIKMLNALMLSINTFTTLGFGEIPIKGLPRYLAIIQGFIGWFMLTIFSVSLISQLLN